MSVDWPSYVVHIRCRSPNASSEANVISSISHFVTNRSCIYSSRVSVMELKLINSENSLRCSWAHRSSIQHFERFIGWSENYYFRRHQKKWVREWENQLNLSFGRCKSIWCAFLLVSRRPRGSTFFGQMESSLSRVRKYMNHCRERFMASMAIKLQQEPKYKIIKHRIFNLSSCHFNRRMSFSHFSSLHS